MSRGRRLQCYFVTIPRSLEASVYEGVSGYIIMQREYFIDWTCDYELTFYPFDTQVS